MNRKRLSQISLPVFGLLLFAFSLWTINNELRQHKPSDVLRSLIEIPSNRLFIAIGCSIGGYLTLTSYDFLAFRYIRRSLPPSAIIFTAFISHAISNSVGFALLTGGAIRYRLYSNCGVSVGAIAQVIAFENLSFWLGLFAVSGIVFILEPLTIPTLLNLPFVSVHPIGVIFLLVVGAYLLGSYFYHQPLRIRGQIFSFPSFRLSLKQIGISLVDWGLAIAVFYLLLPPSIPLSYFGFAGIYLLAMIAGIVSNVPGGLGVFETVILLLLPSEITAPAALGSLIAYRGVYYILPLIVAVVLLGLYEINQRLKVRS
jgi:glycosyltransferase 2 family protein